MFRAGGGSAYTRRREGITRRRVIGARLCASERHRGQDLSAGVVCGRCSHLLAAFRRSDGAVGLDVSGVLRAGHGRYHGCRSLDFLPASLVVARPGRGHRRQCLRRAVLPAFPQRTVHAALDALARGCVLRFSSYRYSLSTVVLTFARPGDGLILDVPRDRGEPGLVPDLFLPQVLYSCATSPNKVGRLRHDPGCRWILPLPAAGRLLFDWRRHTSCSTPPPNGLCAFLSAGPTVHLRGRVTLASVRYRRPHKPHPRLRLTHGHANRTLLRRHRGVTAALHRPHRREVHPRGGGLYARDRRPVQPIETAHPVVYRPPLLPKQVRRCKDARSVLCHAA